MESLDNQPVIVGAGIGGLAAALAMEGPAVLLSAGKLGAESSSMLAQGGIAAAMGADDTPELHAKDTIDAGAGLCDKPAVHMVTGQAASIIEGLIKKGVSFDRDKTGALELGLEGGHGKRRILHAGGDRTGQAITRALIAAVQARPSITIVENAYVTDLMSGGAMIHGLRFKKGKKLETILTSRVLLATGGAGALWRYTTNPLGAWGAGLALAAHAGATLSDLEFMQFHPTAIDIDCDPMPLASEALRGEGAILTDEKGDRFMEGKGRAELSSRDIVSRAIWAHMQKGHRVFLDARGIRDFAKKFPGIHQICHGAKIDPASQPIPVRPAAHYHMGGVRVNENGRSSLEGLWACGEVAMTGLHGANRLASNSMLEALVFGDRAGRDISDYAPATPQHIEMPLRALWPVTRRTRDPMFKSAGVLRDRKGLAGLQQRLWQDASYGSGPALVALMIATAALRREESRGAHARTDFPEATASECWHQDIALADVLSEEQAEFRRTTPSLNL